MTKTLIYMQQFFPGFLFSEDSHKLVESKEFPAFPPTKGCYAVRFYEVESYEAKGEELRGKPKNYSHTRYWGRRFSLEEVKKEYPGERTLISNFEGNKYHSVVRTPQGGWHSCEENDEVIPL